MLGAPLFFYLSKILGFFALPSNSLVVLGILGIGLVLLGRRRVGIRLMALALTLIALAGLSPLGNLLILPLEERFPPPPQGDVRPVAGIVVLGGAFETILAQSREEAPLNEAAERVTAVGPLVGRFPNALLVFSGGSRLLWDGETTEAELARRLFMSFGISPERLLLEDRSRSTAENAAFTKELVTPAPGERWLLVTSAFHMPRAIGAFRAVGFDVEAYPVDYRTRGLADAWRPFSSVGEGLRRVDVAVREWAGLLAYWLTGRIGALYPAP